MARRVLTRCITLSAVAFAADACRGSDEPAEPPTPTSIVAVQPAPGSCTLGVPVTLAARVSDPEGAAVPEVVVTFAVVIGNGSVSPAISETNADGVAKTQFTCAAPTGAEHNAVQATFAGLQEGPAAWSLVASPGALTEVDFISGPAPDSTPVVDGFAQPVAVAGILRDAFGGSPAATVTWEIVGGGGSLTSGSSAAVRCPDVNDVNQAGPEEWCVANAWSIGTGGPGLRVVRLTSPDAPGFEQLFHLRVVPGPVAITQAPASPLSGTVGSTLPAPLEVRVVAGDGTPLPRVIVRFTGDGKLVPLSPEDTAATGSQIYTGADGRALIGYQFPTSIYHSPFRSFFYVEAAITLVDPAGAPTPPLWQVTVTPGSVAQLAITAGDGQAGTVGEPLMEPLQVRVADEFGNGVAGETVGWSVTSGGGSFGNATTLTFGDGLGENVWTLGPTAGAQTATATIGALTVTFTATAGTP